MPEVDGIASLETLREQEFSSCPPPATTLRRAFLANPVGSSVEPAPLVEVLVSQSLCWEHGRTVPITHLTWKRAMSKVGEKAVPEVLRMGELSLPLISCSTRESDPCPTPEPWRYRFGITDPEDMNAELTRTDPVLCLLLQGLN